MTLKSISAIFFLTLVMAVAGCGSTPLPLQGPPVTAVPVDAESAVGLDFYAGQRAESPQLPLLRGQSTLLVRTFHDPAGNNNRKEVQGVCDLTGGSLFTATVKTPGAVTVPNFGAGSLSLFANCVSNERSGSGTLQAYNKTKSDIAVSGASAGLLGLLVATVVAEAVSDDDDVYSYRSLHVNVEYGATPPLVKAAPATPAPKPAVVKPALEPAQANATDSAATTATDSATASATPVAASVPSATPDTARAPAHCRSDTILFPERPKSNSC